MVMLFQREAAVAATTAPAAARGKEQELGQERPRSAPEAQTWPVCSVSAFRQAGCQVWQVSVHGPEQRQSQDASLSH